MWRKERKVGREGKRIRRSGRDGGTARKEKRQDASPAARGVRNQVAAADRFLYDTQTRRFCGPARGEKTHTHTRCTYLWAQYIRDGCQPQTVHFCMYENSTCDCENDRSDWYDCVRERSLATGRAENSFFVDVLYAYIFVLYGKDRCFGFWHSARLRMNSNTQGRHDERRLHDTIVIISTPEITVTIIFVWRDGKTAGGG